MLYLDRSYQVFNLVNQLSAKIIYESIKPFAELPPIKKEKLNGNGDSRAAELFSIFTADIITSNVMFVR